MKRPPTNDKSGAPSGATSRRIDAGENIRTCVGSRSGGRPVRNLSRFLSRYAFGTDPTNTPSSRSTRAIFSEKVPGEADVLEQLTRHNDVEEGVLKWKRFLDIPPDRRDAALGGALERFRVDVQPDDFVSWKEALRHRAGAAPEIEHAFARPADRLDEQRQPLWHENTLAAISLLGVMLPVTLFQAIAIAHVACGG